MNRAARACLASFLIASTVVAPTQAQSPQPAPRVFDAIVVEGNERFRDGDVLATSGLTTGTELSAQDLTAAVEALEYTGEFENVLITSSGSTLKITVEETPEYSGGLTFGLGYDSDFGLFGAAGLSLNNAFGNGTQLRGNLLAAEEVQTLRFEARSASFWSPEQRGGVRLAIENYEFDNTTYQYRLGRIEPYAVFDLSDSGMLELRYTLASKQISDVAPDASPIIQAEEGRKTSSGLGFSIAANGSNETFDAWSIRLDQDFTGLGGDTDLSQTKLALSARKNLSQSGFALRTRVELGGVSGLGDDGPRASERFSLGGASLRGFARGTVAPRDVCAGCAGDGSDLVTLLGGDYYAVMRSDLLVPIFRDRDSIETFVFVDIGTAWSVDTDTGPAGTLNDDRIFRSSVGVGASFDTSLGQFEAYVALAEDAERFDELQAFGLTFRTDF